MYLPLFFILTFFLYGQRPAYAAPSLIQKACTVDRKTVDLNLCVDTLHSYHDISSATTMKDIAIRITQVGISNSTATRTYIEQALTKPGAGPTLIATLNECKTAYDTLIPSFASALGEVKKDKDYQTATYDLLLAATDYVGECEKSVAGNKIVDEVILSGNKAVELFAYSAYQAANDLDGAGSS